MILDYNIIFIIIVIVIIIIILQNTLIRNMIINNNHTNENNRMLAMNGINSQYYISFAHHYNIFSLFKVLTKILNENNIDYIITCGTLLGYCRHNNGFIPWDDDIDICIIEKDLPKFKKVMKSFVKKNNKYHFNKTLNYGLYLFSTSYISDINLLTRNEIFIDIFIINNKDDENKYTYDNDRLKQTLSNEYYNTTELYPLQNGFFKLYSPDGTIYDEILIKIPNKPHLYLDRAYTNWQEKKVYRPHSFYNQFIFNKFIPIDQFKSIIKNINLKTLNLKKIKLIVS